MVKNVEVLHVVLVRTYRWQNTRDASQHTISHHFVQKGAMSPNDASRLAVIIVRFSAHWTLRGFQLSSVYVPHVQVYFPQQPLGRVKDS